MVRALIKTVRPHQWVKNLFVVAPLAFSKHLLDPEFVLWSVVAFGIFVVVTVPLGSLVVLFFAWLRS